MQNINCLRHIQNCLVNVVNMPCLPCELAFKNELNDEIDVIM
jgi:hypothetical protein